MIPAVLLMGLSKSGFGAGFGSLATPLLGWPAEAWGRRRLAERGRGEVPERTTGGPAEARKGETRRRTRAESLRSYVRGLAELL